MTATHQGKTLNIRARRGVILATGCHASNVNFRRMFDPRLTEEYGTVGEPYSYGNAAGQIAALKIGASLWGTANQTLAFEGQARVHYLEKPRVIGSRYFLGGRGDLQKSPIFSRLRAIGLVVEDYQDVIHVSQAGRRFVNEAATEWDWFDPCLALNQGPGYGGGSVWAIFDAEAATREKWVCEPPYVDPDGWFFSGRTLAELANRVVNRYQKQPMPAGNLEETVARYNSFVDAGADADFAKPRPTYKIQTPPFYAAWSTPFIHDAYAGLRINAKCEVIDWEGHAIPGLYCGGESAGGFNMHGLARCTTQGRIAGREAARSAVTTSARG